MRKYIALTSIVACMLIVPLSLLGNVYRQPMPMLSLTHVPNNMVDGYSSYIAYQIYDRLFTYDDMLYIKGELAESWETTNGG